MLFHRKRDFCRIMPDSRWAWAEVIKGKAINGRCHKVEWEFYNKIYVEGMGKLYTPETFTIRE